MWSLDKLEVQMVSTSTEKLKGMIPFPCCKTEKVMAFESSSGRTSNKCPRCGKFAVFDFDRMTAYYAPALRGAAHKFIVNKPVSTEP